MCVSTNMPGARFRSRFVVRTERLRIRTVVMCRSGRNVFRGNFNRVGRRFRQELMHRILTWYAPGIGRGIVMIVVMPQIGGEI